MIARPFVKSLILFLNLRDDVLLYDAAEIAPEDAVSVILVPIETVPSNSAVPSQSNFPSF